MAAEGLRVIAVAAREAEAASPESLDAHLEGLTLLGLIGMMDPPREAARDAVRDCRAAGIRVVMITGDHAVTAAAIAGQLGIGDAGPRVVSGRSSTAAATRSCASWSSRSRSTPASRRAASCGSSRRCAPAARWSP